jgi:hypothetical protein
MSQLDNIIAMATAFQDLSVDIESDTIVLPKSVYYDNLPAGITVEQAIAVNEYNMLFTAATGYYAGAMAQSYFSENPEVETLSVISPLDHAEVNHKVYRTYEINGTEHPMYLTSGYAVNTRNLSEDVIQSVIDQVAGMLPQTLEESIDK